ncbi:sigma-70 family RNA polymerase sigma factor [Nocardioides allogilvus]|uniref:sigma-70 family RNA polymerase sigma factor n=1 Tax=Nocardioides allogilvus TaxID=2072017 RepID=UPI000D320684|nr:sigma-70 family RNA polymerase sigma factor [Nocardioides allogilvus]
MRGRTARTGAEHSPDPLNQLLVLAGRADEDAFAQLYDDFAHRAYGLAVRVLGDPHQAQEVIQDVFLEVWRKAAHFDPRRGSATGWMLTITHRRAVDRVRASSAARRRDDEWHDASPAVTDVDTTFDEAQANLTAVRVRAALDSLTPVQRRAVELAYFGGHTYADVARLMHAPLGTTKSRIRAALVRLRDHLEIPTLEIGPGWA